MQEEKTVTFTLENAHELEVLVFALESYTKEAMRNKRLASRPDMSPVFRQIHEAHATTAEVLYKRASAMQDL